MATYKVIQDVEAEDKLLGPLTLRQVIYAFITAGLIWLCVVLVANSAAFLLVILVPPILMLGFLAIPWHSDQPTEVWALAKIRFLLKPRKRIWDQTGAKELVTITAPKVVQRIYSNNLSQAEVRSRLHALANTVDTRGWAVKNMNVNMNDNTSSDRLTQGSVVAQQVASFDVPAADDILDETANPIAQHFDSMITDAAATHRQQLMAQLNQPAPAQPAQQAPQATPDNYWFMNQPTPASIPGQATFQSSAVVSPGATEDTEPAQAPQAVTPTAADEALVEQIKANAQQIVATDHMKHIKTPEELAEDARQQHALELAEQSRKTAEEVLKAQVTSEKRAAIMNLASNDDLDVATLARQANKKPQSDDGEVVISLR